MEILTPVPPGIAAVNHRRWIREYGKQEGKHRNGAGAKTAGEDEGVFPGESGHFAGRFSGIISCRRNGGFLFFCFLLPGGKMPAGDIAFRISKHREIWRLKDAAHDYCLLSKWIQAAFFPVDFRKMVNEAFWHGESQIRCIMNSFNCSN